MQTPRFAFDEFVLSPRQRVLLRRGLPVPLIPKYFDLLVLLVSRRHEAVAKQTIFTEVWTDVIVSDGALSQAVRTLRRTLGDDSREPRFIRTVSRHGYQFVCPAVEESNDELPLASSGTDIPAAPPGPPSQPLDELVERFAAAVERGERDQGGEEAHDLAERLHLAGTEAALARVKARSDHARLVALLRETRWNVPRAGDVPLLRDREAPAAIAALVRLRVAGVRRELVRRWVMGIATAMGGGTVAGLLGGLALVLAPGSSTHPQSAIALAAIGALAGSAGAAGIGAGLVLAEAVARSRRRIALTLSGASAGALTAIGVRAIVAVTMSALFGLRLPPAGSIVEGLCLGAAIGAGYALGSPQLHGGGLAAPSGRARVRTVAVAGIAGAITAMGLSLSGRLLVGGLVHEIARASRDSDLILAPLGRLLGEPDFGPFSRLLVSALEGGVFGSTLTLGLTTRPPQA